MHFTIDRPQLHDLNSIRMTDNVSGTSVSILPDHGALLHEFAFIRDSEPYNIIDNYPNHQSLMKDLHLSYRGAKLSPFACRIMNATYHFEGKTYTFDNKFYDGSAIHGLLADKKFEVLEQFVNESNACVRLSHQYAGDDAGYPFPYSCTVTYSLQPGNVLKVSTEIINNSDQSIPVADGWHPYFRLMDNVDELQLYFQSEKQVEFNERLVPTGRFADDDRFIKTSSLKGIELDNCFLLPEQRNDEPVCILSNPAKQVSLEIYADCGYSFLQIYTPQDRKSIAIENLSAAPDCFNNSLGVLKLKPKDSTTFVLRYKIKP